MNKKEGKKEEGREGKKYFKSIREKEKGGRKGG
jgi:hypothetical protein